MSPPWNCFASELRGKNVKGFKGLLPESQGKHVVLTVLCAEFARQRLFNTAWCALPNAMLKSERACVHVCAQRLVKVHMCKLCMAATPSTNSHVQTPTPRTREGRFYSSLGNTTPRSLLHLGKSSSYFLPTFYRPFLPTFYQPEHLYYTLPPLWGHSPV